MEPPKVSNQIDFHQLSLLGQLVVILVRPVVHQLLLLPLPHIDVGIVYASVPPQVGRDVDRSIGGSILVDFHHLHASTSSAYPHKRETFWTYLLVAE